METRRLNKLRNILIWIFVGWMGVFVIASVVMVKLRESVVKELLSVRLLDCMEVIEFATEIRDKIHAICDETAMNQCRALVLMLEQRKGHKMDQATLDKIAKTLLIPQYAITDENGIVVYTNHKQSMGYDIHASEQSREFLGALTNPEFEYAQAIRPRSDGKLYKYFGKARRDQRGLVQVAYDESRVQKILSIGNIFQKMELMRIGIDGFVLIAKDNVITAAENKHMVGTSLKDYGVNALPAEGTYFDFWINGTKHLATFEEFYGFQVIGVVSREYITELAWLCFYASVLATLVAVLFIWLWFPKLAKKLE